MNKHIRRPLPALESGEGRWIQDRYCDTRARIRGWVSESERMVGKGVRVRWVRCEVCRRKYAAAFVPARHCTR